MPPRARRQGLEIQDAGDETVVYDVERHRVHRLNPIAAAVWRACDGRSTAAEIASRLPGDAGPEAREQVVELALARLARAHLLEAGEPAVAPRIARGELTSRREALKRLGVAAALFPVVASILAPTPAHAASCGAPGAPCVGNAECCSGTCGGSTPGQCD